MAWSRQLVSRGKGLKVLGIDRDLEKIDLIRISAPPFFEPGLDSYLREETRKETLTVSNVLLGPLSGGQNHPSQMSKPDNINPMVRCRHFD